MMYLIEEIVHLYINSRETKFDDGNASRSFSLRLSVSSQENGTSSHKQVGYSQFYCPTIRITSKIVILGYKNGECAKRRDK